MAEDKSEQLKQIIPMMRRGVAKSLAKRPLTGTAIPPLVEGGVPSWWHAPLNASGVAVDGRQAADARRAPVLFELHGGGFALGDPRKNDALRTWIARRWGVHAVGVGYRLTPENPFPAAIDDVIGVLDHFAENAERYGVDPDAFYLMGCSAGANLALACAFRLQLRASLRFRIRGILLHYPFLDAAAKPEDLDTRDEDLPVEMMGAFNSWYVDGRDPKDPLISPVFASDAQLAALPRVIQYPVDGDALAPSAQTLHERLGAVGADCALHLVEGAYHGYLEDAANLQVYQDTSLPETVAARPASFDQTAARIYAQSLDELLGAPQEDIPFRPQQAAEDAARFARGGGADDPAGGDASAAAGAPAAPADGAAPGAAGEMGGRR